jgi:hypothetical protein
MNAEAMSFPFHLRRSTAASSSSSLFALSLGRDTFLHPLAV